VRLLHVLLIPCVLPAAGCTAVLVAGGKDVSELATRDDVRREFGMPLAADQAGDESHDDYHSRRKIAKGRDWEQAYLMVTALSLGISEVFVFPVEISRTCSWLLFGQDIRFTYDQSGNVMKVEVDGYPVVHRTQPRVKQAAPPPIPDR
jgi:hypothetical protein